MDNKIKNLPCITIITPSLNKAQYIEKCILSVCNQIYPNWEHIVVDGGSTDNTMATLKKYDHLKYIYEPDGGMYDAINKGIQLSKGEIIGYLNCDDAYFPYTIPNVMDIFLKYRNIDFVYGYCSYINEAGQEIYFMRSIPFMPAILKGMGRIPWAQPTTFWRRKIHKKIGMFDSTLKYVGDLDYFFRMILHGNGLRGKIIRKKLAKFMLSTRSISFISVDEFSTERVNILSKLINNKSIKWKLGRAIIGETMFKLSNIDNYIRRELKKKQMPFVL